MIRQIESRVGRRVILSAIAGLAFALAIAPQQLVAGDGDPKVLSTPQAHDRAAAGELLIIDVRSPAEWRETGVPAGARTVTIPNRDGIAAFAAELREAIGEDRERPVAVICASGVRSTAAFNLLQNQGYQNIFNLREGMLGNDQDGPGWIARGLPTEHCPDC